MNLTKKIVGIIGITLSLLTFFPQRALALDGGAGFALVAKETIGDTLAWYAANKVIKKITAQTVNWINSGFKGNPAYITDPSKFFLDVGDNVASRYLSNTSLNQLCAPFKAEVRLALVKNYLYDNENYSCTLSILKNNYDQFMQDFSVGGWDGWFEVTQNNQNNPFGAYQNAQNELAIQIGNQTKKYQNQLNWASGFLSFETCPDGFEITDSDSDQQYLDAGYKVGDCLTEKVTVTPGKVIESQLNESLSSGLKRIEAADEVDEVIAALLDQLMSKALGGAKGLFGLSRPNSNGSTYTTDLQNDNSDEPDLNESCPAGIPTKTVYYRGIPKTICDYDSTEKKDYPAVICNPDSNGVLTCNLEDDTHPTNANGGGSNGGGSTGGDTCSAGIGNSSGAPSTIDESNIVWLDASDAGNWPVTSNLNVSVGSDSITLNYDKANSWPNDYPAFFNGDPVVGNAWVIVWRNGSWYAATFEWLRPGQTSKGLENLLGADGTLAGELGNFSPKVGETYGFVVTTPARAGERTINERTNIVTLVWNGPICSSGSSGGGSTGGGSTGGSTGGGSTTAGSPVITGLTPGTATAGQTTIIISGTNLTSTVQFFGSNGNRSTVVGTLNGSATQVSVRVPSDVSIGYATVKIYKDANTVSNGWLLNITATNGGIVLPTISPIDSWSPPQTANNWWPHLSPDGRYVAYGNWGESWVTDLTNKQNFDLSNPSDIQTGHMCLSGQWIANDTITFVCESDDLPKDNEYRYEAKVGTWTPQRTSDNTALVAGNMFVAADGHWASWITIDGFRLARDNAVLSRNVGGLNTLSVSQNSVVSACDPNSSSICVWDGTTLSKTYSVKSPLQQMTTRNGYILYGGYGPVRGIDPFGTDINLRLSNNFNEFIGDIVMVNGSPWVATMAEDVISSTGYVFLRPWGSNTAIVVKASAVSLSVKISGNNFIIAYNNDVGRMTVLTVPINSNRISIP